MRYSIISISVALILAALVLSAVEGCAPAATPTPTAVPTPVPTPTADAQAIATAQAQAMATAQAAATATSDAFLAQQGAAVRTRSAISTATAQAESVRATATIQAFVAGINALAQTANKAYGPADGALKEVSSVTIPTLKSGMFLRNMIAEVRFFNPADPAIHPWDYGIGFRAVGRNNEYRLLVRSDGSWFLSLGTGVNPDQTAKLSTVNTGKLNNLDASTGGSNHFRVVVQDTTGFFFLNGALVSSLNLSQRNEAGDIWIGSAFSFSTSFPGMETRYKDFMISSLP